jgi:O-antigen/teichoic acid export membrane protein
MANRGLGSTRSALLTSINRIRQLSCDLRISGNPTRALVGMSGGLVTSQIILAITGILSARWLGPSGKGLVTGASTWGQLLGWLAGLGVALAIQVRVAETPAGSRVAAASTALGNGLLYSAVIGTGVGLAAFIPLARSMAHLGTESSSVVALAILPLALSVLAPFLANVQLALGRNRIYAVSMVLGSMTTLALVLVAEAARALSPVVLIGFYLIGGVTGILVSAQQLPWRSININLSTLWKDIRLGARFSLSGIMGLANFRLDVLVMTIFLTSRDIGLYGTANNVMLPITSIPAAIALMTTSQAARLQADGGTRAAASATWRSSRQAFVIALVGGAALAVAAPVIVPALVGNAYRPSIPIVWILISGYIARAVIGVVQAGANGMRRPRVGYLGEGVGLAATVVLLPLLLPRWGITGAAITSSISYCLTAATVTVWLLLARRGTITGAATLPRQIHDESPGRIT